MCPLERALLEVEDSLRASETCHSDLGLQHQITGIAHSPQETEADTANTHCLTCWDWRVGRGGELETPRLRLSPGPTGMPATPSQVILAKKLAS